jgi:propionyl-CoA carboxylase alpha chain
MEQEKPKYKTFLLDDVKYKTNYSVKFEKRKPYEAPNPCILKSFLPGKILKVGVKVGDEVHRGTELCILEAMKMENIVRSNVHGKIVKLNIEKDSKVSKNAILMEFELYESE